VINSTQLNLTTSARLRTQTDQKSITCQKRPIFLGRQHQPFSIKSFWLLHSKYCRIFTQQKPKTFDEKRLILYNISENCEVRSVTLKIGNHFHVATQHKTTCYVFILPRYMAQVKPTDQQSDLAVSMANRYRGLYKSSPTNFQEIYGRYPGHVLKTLHKILHHKRYNIKMQVKSVMSINEHVMLTPEIIMIMFTRGLPYIHLPLQCFDTTGWQERHSACKKL